MLVAITVAALVGALPPPDDAPLKLVLGADVPPAADAPSATFDFDLIPEHKQTPDDLLKANQIEHALHVRRTLLSLHQIFGITTVGLLVATVVLGQASYYDKFSGQNTGKFEVWHDYLEASATLGFATTGLLAAFAPVPFPKKANGTILIHKIAMITASAGFLAEIILGVVTVSLEGNKNQLTLAEAHLVTGYSILAATTVGVGVLFFP
jgi:hypothetical protein